ncbi:hypothetical protein [uncultured Agrobacterium sp.]|uniref:hypothetical protein n=1 Tax=uncultured Agrobacterium sp. TaxID=157277 RepID=UPI0025F180BA|nr:hypothetical protein [uncultured Agrobacterium sp.]
MNLILHIVAIALRAAAFFSSPDAPKKMLGLGIMAALTFVAAISYDPTARDYGLDCRSYSKFA